MVDILGRRFDAFFRGQASVVLVEPFEGPEVGERDVLLGEGMDVFARDRHTIATFEDLGQPILEVVEQSDFRGIIPSRGRRRNADADRIRSRRGAALSARAPYPRRALPRRVRRAEGELR